MALTVLLKQLLGTGILLVDHLEHFVVDNLCGGFGVGALELILLVVVVADVGQLVAHSGVGYHAVGALGGPLEVVHSAGGDVSREEFFGGTSSEQRTELVEHLLLGGYLPLFGQVPCGSESLTARHDAHLYERVGIAAEPRHGGMAGLVEGDGALL